MLAALELTVEVRAVMRRVLVAMLAVALSGCGAPRPESGPADVRLGDAVVDLITGSGTFPGRQYLVAKADELVTERCMRAAGLSWSGYVDKPAEGSDEDRALDLAGRRARGYGLSGGGQEAGGTPADDPRVRPALFGGRDELAKLAVPGIGEVSYPEGGCQAEGHAAVFGDMATWARLTYLPPGINLALARSARADRRYLDAVEAWSGCMAEHGYRYATPGAARAGLAHDYQAGREPVATLRARETAVAVRDALCDHEARLSATELDLRRAGARGIGAGQRAEMAGLAAGFDAAVERARALAAN